MEGLNFIGLIVVIPYFIISVQPRFSRLEGWHTS